MVLKNKLFRQLLRFGMVGASAATVHFSLVVFFVEIGQLQPLIANVIGFLVAFQVSYWGHRYWTFSGTSALHRVALPKLLLVASSGFVANESLFYIFTVNFNLPYPLALFLILSILPLINFTLGKFWVFR
ncbi:MAG: GtrA family protein [Gammaproteobacteria bacterium]